MEALKLLRQAGYLEGASAVAPLLSDPVPEIQQLAIETASRSTSWTRRT